MGATLHEQELAQQHGVLIKTFVKPVKITGDNGKAREIELEYTMLTGDKLTGSGNTFSIPADQVFKAIGQTLVSDALKGLEIVNGKIAVDEQFHTTLPGIFAGGDCIERGEDLTVTGVQHGKLAAHAIHERLGGKNNG